MTDTNKKLSFRLDAGGFELSKNTWAYLLAGVILAVIIGISYCRKHAGDEGYQTLVNN